MRSLNSVFNGKYFVCSLLRILPYGGIMAAVIAFFDALFFRAEQCSRGQKRACAVFSQRLRAVFHDCISCIAFSCSL